jgi:hypothetical protein
MSEKGLKIVSLAIENIMKIRAAFIVPKDNMIVVQGENEAGKSTVLDSILYAFKGDRSLPELPVKKGSKKGEIVIKIDGNDKIPPFTITRTITDKKASIEIEPVEVLHGETPRSFMDKIIGSVSFDPLEFINQEGKRQRQVLLELIGINVDELDKKEKAVFDERTIKGRELKTAEAKVKGLKVWNDVKETEEAKVADLSKKLTEAMTFNQDIKNRESANQRLKESGMDDKAEIASINNQIFKLQQQIKDLEDAFLNKREQFRVEHKKLSEIEPIDVEIINAELQSIESKNAKIRDNIAYRNMEAELISTRTAYNVLDSRLEILRIERLKLIQEAAIPVSGLTFYEDGLLFNDIPLSQCSDGAKLMIGTAISMALNPTMKVLRIKDGSLLGPKNMKILEDLVKEKDFQLWIERVSDKDQFDKSGKVGIFIEEGEIIEGGAVADKVADTKKSDPVSTKSTKQDEEDW